MIYRIYCLKNELDEIVYVGQTNRELSVRLSEHSVILSNISPVSMHSTFLVPILQKVLPFLKEVSFAPKPLVPFP